MILLMWGGLPLPDIVTGAAVFLCMTETIFEAGQPLSVRDVVRTVEREVVLSQTELIKPIAT